MKTDQEESGKILVIRVLSALIHVPFFFFFAYDD